jgi:hypothetical protein
LIQGIVDIDVVADINQAEQEEKEDRDHQRELDQGLASAAISPLHPHRDTVIVVVGLTQLLA